MNPGQPVLSAHRHSFYGADNLQRKGSQRTHHLSHAWHAILKLLLVVIALAVTALMTAPSAAASGAPTVTTVVRHVAFAEHYPPYCGIPGTTEYLTATDRYQLVAFPDGSVNVAWGGSFKIHQVYDDPAITPIDRQGSNAGRFSPNEQWPRGIPRKLPRSEQ